VTSATLPSRLKRSIRLPTSSLAASRPLLPSWVLAAAQPRKRQIPALARTTITVIHRTAPTTSQQGAGEAGKLRRAFRRPGTRLRGPIRQPDPVQQHKLPGPRYGSALRATDRPRGPRQLGMHGFCRVVPAIVSRQTASGMLCRWFIEPDVIDQHRLREGY
jgi:hypothetical protein